MFPIDKIKIGSKIVPDHVKVARGDTTFCCYPKNRPEKTSCNTCSFFNDEPRTVSEIRGGRVIFSSPICFPLLTHRLAKEFKLVDEYIWRKL